MEYYFDNELVKKLTRRRRYFQGRYSYEEGTLREVDYRYKLKLYDKSGNKLMKLKYDRSAYKDNTMEDDTFYSRHGFAKLKAYKDHKKDFRIKVSYVNEKRKFLLTKHTRQGLMWKKDSYVSDVDVNQIVQRIIQQTNLDLIPKEK